MISIFVRCPKRGHGAAMLRGVARSARLFLRIEGSHDDSAAAADLFPRAVPCRPARRLRYRQGVDRECAAPACPAGRRASPGARYQHHLRAPAERGEEPHRSARAPVEARRATSLSVVPALELNLARAQAEQAADLWTLVWRTASETQVAMLGQVQSQVGQLSERMRETYSAATRVVENAVNNGVNEGERRSA